MEMMTAEQFEKMTMEDKIKTVAENIEKAKDDNTPYLAVVNDEVNVLGDPNKTERKPTTYKIRFCFPKTDTWREYIRENAERITEETRDYLVVTRTYKDVIVPVSQHTSLVVAFAELSSFFKVIKKNGEIKDMNEEQIGEVARYFDDAVRESAYKVVATLLNISPIEVPHIHPNDVMYTVALLANNTEEIPNEGDVFLE